MAEAQGPHQQARHDLVANAEQRGTLEHAVAERDRGGEGNRVAAEQRQLHAGIALRHAVAHGGHAACDLRGGTRLARPHLHLLGVAIVRRMCREHVVIGGDDADVHRLAAGQGRAVLLGAGISVQRKHCQCAM